MQPWINGLLSASHRIKLAVHAKSLAPAIGYGTPTRFLSPPDTRFHLTKLLAHGTRVIRHAAGKMGRDACLKCALKTRTLLNRLKWHIDQLRGRRNKQQLLMQNVLPV